MKRLAREVLKNFIHAAGIDRTAARLIVQALRQLGFGCI